MVVARFLPNTAGLSDAFSLLGPPLPPLPLDLFSDVTAPLDDEGVAVQVLQLVRREAPGAVELPLVEQMSPLLAPGAWPVVDRLAHGGDYRVTPAAAGRLNPPEGPANAIATASAQSGDGFPRLRMASLLSISTRPLLSNP